jgi:hypothetical protein
MIPFNCGSISQPRLMATVNWWALLGTRRRSWILRWGLRPYLCRRVLQGLSDLPRETRQAHLDKPTFMHVIVCQSFAGNPWHGKLRSCGNRCKPEINKVPSRRIPTVLSLPFYWKTLGPTLRRTNHCVALCVKLSRLQHSSSVRGHGSWLPQLRFVHTRLHVGLGCLRAFPLTD